MFPFEVGQRWVYVLELEGGNYYVGQSDKVEKRFRRHGTKRGSAWATIYKPIREIDIIDAGLCTENEALKIENKVTIEMMHKHGWMKVRGGDFTSPNELIVYNQLISAQKTYEISFVLYKPESVKKSIYSVLEKG